MLTTAPGCRSRGKNSHCVVQCHAFAGKNNHGLTLKCPDEAIKINFIKSRPLSAHLFNIPCDKWEVHTEHFCCIPKYDLCLEASICVIAWDVTCARCFFRRTPYLLQEQLIDKLWFFGISQKFLENEWRELKLSRKATDSTYCQW